LDQGDGMDDGWIDVGAPPQPPGLPHWHGPGQAWGGPGHGFGALAANWVPPFMGGIGPGPGESWAPLSKG
jgi:hypothetical protein